MLLSFLVALLLCITIHVDGTAAVDHIQADRVGKFFGKNGGAGDSEHTNNWAVLVCASRYWFNYRVRVSLTNLLSHTPNLDFSPSIWRMPSECVLFFHFVVSDRSVTYI
jgi:glycosylphosphatidylinositol transamidase (GPIT) subunit GPI8